MKDVFKEIAVLPGVAGSCLFSKSRGNICSELPADFSDDRIRDVAHHCSRLMQMAEVAGLGLQVLALRFDRFTLLAMPVDKDTSLLTVCDAESNCSLVATTISMLAGDLASWLGSSRSGPGRDGTPAPSTPPVEAITEELSPLLQGIGEALAFAIGPVADLVLEDHLDRWRRKGPQTRTRLGELVEMLSEEIDDEESIAEFKKRVEKVLQG